jgi:hypothetical protein
LKSTRVSLAPFAKGIQHENHHEQRAARFDLLRRNEMSDKGITVVTNNVPRDLICFHDLRAEVQKDFDYVARREERSDLRFFAYKGAWYDSHEFMRCNDTTLAETHRESFKEWDGYQSDTYFSGVLIKFVDDNERVIVARYFS